MLRSEELSGGCVCSVHSSIAPCYFCCSLTEEEINWLYVGPSQYGNLDNLLKKVREKEKLEDEFGLDNASIILSL